MPDTIIVRGLQKVYGSLHAVDGVSFEVAAGEFFGILGPNGAGKTTTLEIVEGLREADGGEVSVLGLPPWPRNPRLLPRIGVQLQASSFFERLTAREQIGTFAALYGVGARRADEMLELVGLTGQAGTRTEKLSGGQAQRLSIACALVHDPEIVFLDEPTGALDPQARRNLWDTLRAISAEGRTVVLTTHHMDEAELLCERVAIMDHGKILQTGPPAALIRELDFPSRITVGSGLARPDEARAALPGTEVTDDGVTLAITARDPGPALAWLSGRGALAGLQLAVFLLIATTPYFGLRLTDWWWMSIPIVMAGTLAFLAFGLLAGAITRTEQAATALANMIILPMAFLGGAFLPLAFAPAWIQQVSYLMPLRYLVTGVQDVMARGDGPSAAVLPVVVLLGIAAVLTLVAVRLFRWDEI